MAKPYGRALPAGWDACGTGERCGNVVEEAKDGKHWVRCVKHGGNCGQSDAPCDCHLFWAPHNAALTVDWTPVTLPDGNPVPPGERIEKTHDTRDYKCICAK